MGSFCSFKESSQWQYFDIVKELNDKEFYDYMKLYLHITDLSNEKETEILLAFLAMLGLLRSE